ncbi:putative bifunctional UDP-N-acetylglucosamine transferase and deubiquitinase ALG13 [Halotydeus destructor]|nr:putative bifunctional UDP-N-acetylglucosamine transferase and deubiquitinase ALG13 [Halotydeus destructor]
MMIFKPTVLDLAMFKIGLNRKHIPRETNSLFRCFAEAVYLSQLSWDKVEADYSVTVSPDSRNCSDPLGQVRDLGQLYGRPVEVFVETDGGFWCLKFLGSADPESEPIRLSFDRSGHFDLVYSDAMMSNLAMAQSIVYQLFHSKFLGYSEEELQDTLDNMLKNKYYSQLKSQRKLLGPRLQLALQSTQWDANELLKIPPMPYKTAKALDCTLYRNIQMDIWLKKVQSAVDIDQGVFAPGTKCYVTAEGDWTERKLFAYVQRLLPDGMAMVYVYQYADSIKVPVKSLMRFRPKPRREHAVMRTGYRPKKALLGDSPQCTQNMEKPPNPFPLSCLQPLMPIAYQGLNHYDAFAALPFPPPMAPPFGIPFPPPIVWLLPPPPVAPMALPGMPFPWQPVPAGGCYYPPLNDYQMTMPHNPFNPSADPVYFQQEHAPSPTVNLAGMQFDLHHPSPYPIHH